MYNRIKLFVWWHYILEENEFHYTLYTAYLASHLGYSARESIKVLVARRELAHALDGGDSMDYLLAYRSNTIKKANLRMRDFLVFLQYKMKKGMHDEK